MAIKSYRDLQVWQKAMDLVVESYKVVNLLPRNEVYSLATQIQRAAVSIPANIAEGHGREHLGDYLHHLSCANGSLMELETHFLIASKLSYITEPQLESVLGHTSELGRMLSGLINKLKARRDTLAPDT
jgi:four helix bundle protein